MEISKIQADFELIKLHELLEEILLAEDFVKNADESVVEDITIPTNWINYEELKYVYKMQKYF